jgi:hypothetical protein
MLEKVPVDIASWCFPYLVAKSSHVGVDVDGLTYPLHCPMAYIHQIRGQGFLPGVVLSHRAAAGGGALLRDVKPHAWIFVKVLTAWVPVSKNFIRSILLLLGYVYLMLESLWCVYMYPWSSYHFRR